jgi:hypothetical protein
MHHQWEAFLVMRAQAIQPLLLAARKLQAVSVTEVTVVPMVARVMPTLQVFTRTQ